MKITPEHNQVRTLKELTHYEAHPQRTESEEFSKIKRKFKREGRKCFIDNGYCAGQLEVHHSIIELSAASGVDWERVKSDYPKIDHADDIDQMMVLCSKHHRGKYTGVHSVSYNTWILQKYMTAEALEDFETAIKGELEEK